MSTGLNSMTGVIYEDMIKPLSKTAISEEKASYIMKLTVIVIGVLCVAMVFVVEHLGTLIQVSVNYKNDDIWSNIHVARLSIQLTNFEVLFIRTV